MSTVQNVLIIELKRGGFKLSRDERNQAQGYVEDFINCGSLIGSPYVHAFVVGERIASKMSPTTELANKNDVKCGKIRIATYAQLVDTAEKRLFGLREKLGERYDDIPGVDLYKKSAQPNLWTQ